MNRLPGRFRITHPFHPGFGEELELIRYRRSWGHESVDGRDRSGATITLPVVWTDARAPDPFLAMSRGRSHFRVDDLLRLAQLVADLAG